LAECNTYVPLYRNFAFDEGYAANKEKSNPVGLLRSLSRVDKKDADL
jgi:hypothetical protein